MPQFLITGPDGSKYRVTGDNAEGALKALQDHLGSATKPDASSFHQPVDASTVAADEMLFGLPGKAAAAMNAAVQAPFSDKTFGQIYDEQRQGYQGARAQYAQEHPVANVAASLAGGLVGGGEALKGGKMAVDALAPALSSRIGKSIVGRMAGDAAGGAALGGLSAYGHDQNIGTGALMGGVLGAATRPLVEAGTGVVKSIGGMLGIGNEGRAKQAVYEALMRSGKTAPEVTADLQAAATDGQPEYMLADALGHSGQRMLAGIARSPGDMRQTIAETLQRRQAGQGDRLVNALSEGFNAPETAARTRTAMEAQRTAQANANYGAARASAGAVDPTEAIRLANDFLKPGASGVMRNSSNIADDSIENAVRKARAYLTDGRSILSDFGAATRAKQEMDAMIEGARPAVQRQLIPIRNALDDALANASPDYANARNVFRQQSRAIDAIDTGRAATSGRTRAEDNTGTFNAMTPAEQQAFRVGYVDPLIARVENASMSPTTNKARALITPKTGAEFPAFAAPGKADQMGNRIAREQRMFETANAALGGSRTAENLADIGDAGTFDPTMIGHAITHPVSTAVKYALTRGAQVIAGRNQQTRDMIARALMQSSPTRVNAEIASAIESGKQLTARQQAVVNALLSTTAPRLAASQ